MKKILLFIFVLALIAACTQVQGGNSEAKPGSEEDSVSAVEYSERSEQASYVPKYKNVKEALDACGVDSFWVNYFPITIHVNSKECYIWPPIGETTFAINSFPFVEYLVENQTKNPPFVTKKDLGEIIIFVDGGEIWITTFAKGKQNITKIMYADTLENYAQTFSPNFEKFYKLLNTYKNNYEIQRKYYEENHKFIGE